MATISVLSYGNPSVAQALVNNSNVMKVAIVNRAKCSPALQIKTNAVNKNNNNNNNINNNNNNTNNNLTKPNLNAKPSTNKRSYGTMAKKQKVQPLSETNTNVMGTVSQNKIANTSVVGSSAMQRSAKLAKTLKRELPEINTTLLCRASGGKSKVFPMPMAVARRNARERNRVKQVNNGFAALRDRIPEEVAEAFEAQGNGRGSIKKLSKVETLRMAVEYIRSLERVLEIDSSSGNAGDKTMDSSIDFQLANDSYQLSDTSSVLSTLTPPPSDNISSGSFDESDGLPDITVIEGHQYIRIPGTNTYQLLETSISGDDTSMAYENDENIEPIIIQSNQNNNQQSLQHLMLHQQQQQQQQLQSPPIDDYPTNSINCFSNDVYNSQIHILTPASISPGAYSMQSSTAGLSPALHDATTAAAVTLTTTTAAAAAMPLNTTQFLTTTDMTEIKNEISPLPSLNDSALYTIPLADLPINQQYEGILTLQTKLKDDIDLSDEHALSDESMLEAMNWWNSHQQQQQLSNTDPIIHDS